MSLQADAAALSEASIWTLLSCNGSWAFPRIAAVLNDIMTVGNKIRDNHEFMRNLFALNFVAPDFCASLSRSQQIRDWTWWSRPSLIAPPNVAHFLHRVLLPVRFLCICWTFPVWQHSGRIFYSFSFSLYPLSEVHDLWGSEWDAGGTSDFRLYLGLVLPAADAFIDLKRLGMPRPWLTAWDDYWLLKKTSNIQAP